MHDKKRKGPAEFLLHGTLLPVLLRKLFQQGHFSAYDFIANS